MLLSRKERLLRTKVLCLVKGLPKDGETLTKDQIRGLHAQQRLSRLADLNGSFNDVLWQLRQNLANPREVQIPLLSPRLVPVQADTKESEIFAAASLVWSVPVSQGFGRRMRFLVRDEANGKLIGIIGLTDPVFNLGPRDDWVGWSSEDRKERLVNVMDAFVLGALPPYSMILGGKLVALLAGSREVVRSFRSKYRDARGVISRCRKSPRLVLLTTTSALGRSSLYNRLKIKGGIEYLTEVEEDRVPTWFTQGYGHFHIPDEVFHDMQQVLIRRDHPYAVGNRFGDGPNWKIRLIRQAAAELGIEPDVLQHGIRRQVYLVPLAENTRSFLKGESMCPRYRTLSVAETCQYWRERWAGPRAERCPEWGRWNCGGLMASLQRLHALAAAPGGR